MSTNYIQNAIVLLNTLDKKRKHYQINKPNLTESFLSEEYVRNIFQGTTGFYDYDEMLRGDFSYRGEDIQCDIVPMTAEEYYERCAIAFRVPIDYIKKWKLEDDEQRTKHLVDIISNGQSQFPLPVLDYTQEPVWQEGCHRIGAIALVHGWDVKVPVVLVTFKDEEDPYQRHKNKTEDISREAIMLHSKLLGKTDEGWYIYQNQDNTNWYCLITQDISKEDQSKEQGEREYCYLIDGDTGDLFCEGSRGIYEISDETDVLDAFVSDHLYGVFNKISVPSSSLLGRTNNESKIILSNVKYINDSILNHVLYLNSTVADALTNFTQNRSKFNDIRGTHLDSDKLPIKEIKIALNNRDYSNSIYLSIDYNDFNQLKTITTSDDKIMLDTSEDNYSGSLQTLNLGKNTEFNIYLVDRNYHQNRMVINVKEHSKPFEILLDFAYGFSDNDLFETEEDFNNLKTEQKIKLMNEMFNLDVHLI